MFCENCGKKLIRGYAFCMECGSPVPPEVLEEGGMPGRTGDHGAENDSPEESKAFDADENTTEAQSSMPGIEPIGNSTGETLVFCPNCGTNMQKSRDHCEKCGMSLTVKARRSPVSQGGVPLVNENPDDFGSQFGGVIGGLSDNDIQQADDFANGRFGLNYEEENTNLFDNQVSADDLSILTQQLANFSASTSQMPSVEEPKKKSGKVHQKHSKKGDTFRVKDFSMADSDDPGEDMELSDGKVPVIEGCSMDEGNDNFAVPDPYAFLNNSMDEGAFSEDLDDEDEYDEDEEYDEVSDDSSEDSEPVTEESVPKAEEVEPVAEEIVPEAEEVEPVAEETVPEAEEVEPVAEEAVPEAEEVEPVAEEIVPEAEEVEPVAEEAVPEAEEVEPVAEETIPEAEEVEPVAEETIPEAEEVEPVAEETISEAEAFEPVAEEAVPEAEETVPETEQNEMASEETMPEVGEANHLNEENKPDESYPDPEEDFIPEEAPFIAETNPFIEEYKPKSAAAAAVVTENQPAAEAPTPAADPIVPPRRPDSSSEEEQPKGNLVYCRNCGQDMYDTEKICKNCGAPYKGAYVPPKNAPSRGPAKAPIKLFGKIPLSAIIGTASAVVVVIAISVFININGNKGQNVGGQVLPPDSQTSSSVPDTNSTSSDESQGSDIPDHPDEPDSSDSVSSASGSDSSSTSTGSSSSSSRPNSGSSSSSSSKPASGSSGSNSSSSSSKPASSSNKPASSSSKPASSNTVVTPPVVTSSKVKSLENDREKIMGAAAVIAGEVGKIDMLAQNAIYSIDNSSGSAENAKTVFYSGDFAKNMISLLKSGHSTVESVVSTASPANSELSSQYKALKSLKSAYENYYKFILSPTGSASRFSSNCVSYLNKFTSSLSALNLQKFFTSSYTYSDKNSAYASAGSAAVDCGRSAVSALATLRQALVDIGSSKFDSSVGKTIAKTGNIKQYANAAGYTFRLNAYAIMISGVESGYSGVYSSLASAESELVMAVDSYSYIRENSYSNYKSESNGYISNATYYITAAQNKLP